MKIFKRFFSNKKKIKKLKDSAKELKKENADLLKRIRDPNYADLMRDNLKSLNLRFENAQIPDYLDGLSEDERRVKIVQVNELYKNEMFTEIIDYLINKQANFVLREAVNDAQIYAGRFNINGMILVKKEVERCHVLFEEINSKEDFNPLGII
jgi:hypothetical protein